MSRRFVCSSWIVGAALGVLVGCADKAKPEYERCQQLEGLGQLDAAVSACNAASLADPASADGKLATTKVDDLKRKIDDASKAAAAERATLLTGGVSELRSLVAKYPGSEEAVAAAGKIASLESICVNLDAWALARSLDCDGLKKSRTGMVPAECVASLGNLADSAWRTMENTDPSKQEAVLAMLAKTGPDREIDSLTTTEATIKTHAVRPGEEAIRQSLVNDYEKVIQAYRRWADVMRGYRTRGGHVGSIETIAAMVTATNEEIIPPLKDGERKRADQCRTMASSPPPAPTMDGGAGGTGATGGTDAAAATVPARTDGTHDPADVAFAQGLVGKNLAVMVSDFKKHPAVNDRFVAMLGPAYKAVTAPGVVFPIVKVGDNIVAEGCPAHQCGGDANFIVVVDLTAGTLHCGVMTNGKPRIYSEDPKNAPTLLSKWKRDPSGWRR